MKTFYYLFGILLLLSFSGTGYGQDNQFGSDTVPSLNFDAPLEENAPKKKKVKKKVFYGLKCKRGFTRKGTGNKETVETFYFLKHYKDPNPYAKKIYLFDVTKQQIVELSEIDKKKLGNYRILHGPYKKIYGGEVVESGIFYVGTKHGRWEKYSSKKTDTYNEEEITYATLIDKEKYYKGWPKESKISFYDGTQTKVKEVFPYRFGKLNGDYYHFKENGELLKEGQFADGKKVGLWVEYFPDKNKKLREIQYPATPYVEQFEPYTLTEWNENGQMIVRKGEKVEPGKKGADPLKEKFKRNKKK